MPCKNCRSFDKNWVACKNQWVVNNFFETNMMIMENPEFECNFYEKPLDKVDRNQLDIYGVINNEI